MRFKEAVGQETISQELIGSVLEKKLGHSLLFLGPEGCGNLTMAIALSQLLVCKNPSAAGACMQCIPCKKAEKMVHPDIHYTFPFINRPPKKTDCTVDIAEWREMVLENPVLNDRDWLRTFGTKAGNINHFECRNVIQKLMLKSYEGGNKVWILWNAEYLGPSGNILLKLIEEPPPDTYIILLASNSQKILDTVLSRTQRVQFPSLPEKVVADFLIKEEGVKEEDANSIASQVNGNLNLARKLGGQSENREQELLIRWLTACLSNDISEINQWVEVLNKEIKETQKGVLEYTLYIIQLSLKSKYVQNTTSYDQLVDSLVSTMNNHLDFEQLSTVADIFEKALYYMQRNANSALLFYNISLQFSRQLKAKPSLA